jgi:hypothetical protein
VNRLPIDRFAPLDTLSHSPCFGRSGYAIA